MKTLYTVEKNENKGAMDRIDQSAGRKERWEIINPLPVIEDKLQDSMSISNQVLLRTT